MKTVLFLFFVLVNFQIQARSLLSQSYETSSDLDSDEEECIAELNLNRDKIRKISLLDLAPEDNPEFNKFVGCTCKKKGFLKPNGKVNFDAIAESLLEIGKRDSDHTEAAYSLYEQIITISVDICRKHPPRGSTPGETATKTLNCIAAHVIEALE